MARKTTRQKQSERIAREKAQKMRRRVIVRRCIMGGCVLTVALLLGGGTWLMKSGAVSRAHDAVIAGFYNLTSDAGFTVRNVYVDGRAHTPMPDVQAALALHPNMSIFEVSPAEMRARLEGLERVGYAEVERVLPSTLHVHLVERQPVAIWQNHGAMKMLDITGKIITDANVAAYAGLPVLVGEDVPAQMPDLMRVLAQDKSIYAQVESALRVGERRWDVRLKNGIEIKLPERGMEGAWTELVAMQKKDKVLERMVKTIDLRLPGKVYVKIAPAPSQTAPAGGALPPTAPADAEPAAGPAHSPVAGGDET